MFTEKEIKECLTMRKSNKRGFEVKPKANGKAFAVTALVKAISLQSKKNKLSQYT